MSLCGSCEGLQNMEVVEDSFEQEELADTPPPSNVQMADGYDSFDEDFGESRLLKTPPAKRRKEEGRISATPQDCEDYDSFDEDVGGSIEEKMTRARAARERRWEEIPDTPPPGDQKKLEEIPDTPSPRDQQKLEEIPDTPPPKDQQKLEEIPDTPPPRDQPKLEEIPDTPPPVEEIPDTPPPKNEQDYDSFDDDIGENDFQEKKNRDSSGKENTPSRTNETIRNEKKTLKNEKIDRKFPDEQRDRATGIRPGNLKKAEETIDQKELEQIPDTPPPVDEIPNTPTLQGLKEVEEIPGTPPPNDQQKLDEIRNTPLPKDHPEYDSFDEDIVEVNFSKNRHPPGKKNASTIPEYYKNEKKAASSSSTNVDEIPDTPPPNDGQEYDSFDEDIGGLKPAKQMESCEFDSFDEDLEETSRKRTLSSSDSSSASDDDPNYVPDHAASVGRSLRRSTRKASRMELEEEEYPVDHPTPHVLKTLNEFYGHKKFREKQWEVVRNALMKRDQFVLMSTGYGKSVCYQLPSLVKRSLTIVVSPLISLMNDQVSSLRAKGIRALKIDGAASSEWQEAEDESVRFVYMSPEMIGARGMRLLEKLANRISLIAIDEAHCISKWGHDFRSSYRQLSSIRRNPKLESIPMIALTATATARVQTDIMENLRMRNAIRVLTPIDRKNLYVSVEVMKDAGIDLEPLLVAGEKGPSFGGPCIVYCQTRKMTEMVDAQLKAIGVACGTYHAGMSKKERERVHEKFMQDKLSTMVATVAFGMGIDKPDVRHVIHYGCPKDLESYYQEIGRAGRDGMPSRCRVFWKTSDMVLIRQRLLDQKASQEVIDHGLEMIRHLDYYLTTTSCRRYVLLKHFQESTPKPVQPEADCCDNCTKMLDSGSTGGVASMDVGKEARLLFAVIREMYDGRTGIGKTIDFIRSTGNEEWRAKTMAQKKLYGCGKEMSEKWWKALAAVLRSRGFLTDVKMAGMSFGSCVKLTPAALAWMDRGEKELMIESNPVLIRKTKVKVAVGIEAADDMRLLASSKQRQYKSAEQYPMITQKTTTSVEPSMDKIRQLRAKLDALRVSIADGYELPPFQVATNTVLDSFAARRPSSKENLKLIDGMSSAQMATYGQRFIDCIVEYCTKNHVGMDVTNKPAIPPELMNIVERELTPAIQRIYLPHLTQKLTIEELSQTRGISRDTVWNYLTTAIGKGLPVHLDVLGVTMEIIVKVLGVIREKLKNDVHRLKPIMEQLPEGFIDYGVLKAARGIIVYEYGYEEGRKDEVGKDPVEKAAKEQKRKRFRF